MPLDLTALGLNGLLLALCITTDAHIRGPVL